MVYDLSYAPLQPPSRARKAPIGYGQQYGLAYSGSDDPVELESMGQGERSELLQQLSDASGTAVSGLLDGLGWLGNRSKEIVANKRYGTNPSGLDVLKTFGIRVPEKAWGGYARPLANFATDTLFDPLTYTGFGALGGGLSKAGKAAKAANLLDDAARSMSRDLVDDIVRGGSSVDDLGKIGKRSADFWAKEYGKDVTRLTDEDLFARPLHGWRQARRDQTLGELLERQKDWGQEHYDSSVENLKDWLYRNGGWSPDPDRALESLKGQKLSSDLSFMGMGVNVPFGGSIAREMDNLGNYVRWSRPGAYATSAFSRQLHGATDAASQVGTISLSRGDEAADAIARRKAHNLVSLLPKFKDGATDIRMGNAIRNVIEDIGPTLKGDDLVAHDEVLKALTDYRAGTATGDAAGIGQFIDEWGKLSKDYINRSRDAGIGSNELNDTFGTRHFPRILDELTFGGANQTPSGGRTFSVTTGDQLARDTAFHVPGGTQTLRELSLDPNVAGSMRVSATDDSAAEYILGKMRQKEADLAAAGRLPVDDAGKPAAYAKQQALTLARKLREIDRDTIKKGLPMFGMHPAEAMTRYMSGRERAIRRAGTLTDMLSSSAVETMPGKPFFMGPSHIPGGGAVSMTDALNSLDLKTVDRRDFMGPLPAGVPLVEGAKQQVLDRLHQIGLKHGIPEFTMAGIDSLSKVSVDSRLLQRLNRIADFYQVPEAQSQLFKTLDAVTSLWKASILSWPARFVRDWYSGMFSNVIEAGNMNDVWAGYAGAKGLIQGQDGTLLPILGRMPRYAKIAAPEARMSAYLEDLAAQGISRGRQLDDVGQTVAARQSSQGVRGELLASNAPETTFLWQLEDAITGKHLTGDAVSPSRLATTELFNLGNWKKTVTGIPQTIWDAARGIKQSEIHNPMLRWSARLGETTDKINRIAGFNALLLQGISPEQAAKRIMAAHVDYNSLTKFERGFIRTMLPFWAYESRIAKWALTKMAEHPGGIYTKLGMKLPADLAENDIKSDYVPTRIADKYGLSLEPMRKIPGLGGLVDMIAPSSAGVSSWVSDIDLPGIDQINKIKIKRDADTGNIALGGTALASVGQIAEGAHPLVKNAYEISTGRDAYTGLKKNYQRNALPTILNRAGTVDASDYNTLNRLGYLDQALQFLMPFYSRGMQTARKLTDPRIETQEAAALQALLNASAGVKIENIDDMEKQRDALDKIKELLDEHPAVRSYDSTYIPKELLPFVDERTQRLYVLDRQLRKERRNMNKVRPDVANSYNY